jgi:hypothetical protein
LGRTGLSRKELSRVEVMGRVKAHSLRLREAAERLELSYRQAKRIWARYGREGQKALQHGNCRRVSNRACPATTTRGHLYCGMTVGGIDLDTQRGIRHSI